MVHLVDVIFEYGNPFQDKCPELLVLNTRNCVDSYVISAVNNIEILGSQQYQQFVKEVLVDKSRPANAPIKRNSLPLMNSPKCKVKSELKQIAALRSHADLFDRLYIANQPRDGDPAVFFCHENQMYSPALSEFGKLRKGSKCDLLKCLDTSPSVYPPAAFDCKIFDGAVLVHALLPSLSKTFSDYANCVFIPFVLKEFLTTERLHIVWDSYLSCSIKGQTRDNRGTVCD